jgi:hypothetical protein
VEPKSALPEGGSSIKRNPQVHSEILDERKRQRNASDKNYTRITSEVELRQEDLARLQTDIERGAVLDLNDSLSFINKNIILDPHVAAEERF